MAKSKLVQANEKIAEGVVSGYKKMEQGIVDGYKKMEKGVVGGFTKMTDKFVEEFLTKDGESVEDAKKRLAQEQALGYMMEHIRSGRSWPPFKCKTTVSVPKTAQPFSGPER